MAKIPTAINEPRPSSPRERILWPYTLGGVVVALLIAGSFKLIQVFDLLVGTVEDLSQQVEIENKHVERATPPKTETPIEKSRKVKLGMSYQDVVSIMGKPDKGSVTDSISGKVSQYNWHFNDTSIVIKIRSGVVESITRPKM